VARRIRAFLRRLVSVDGKSLLLTSHVLSEVDELADRVALIHEGRIPTVGTSRELKAAIGAVEFVEVEAAALSPTVQEQIMQLEPVLFRTEREAGWASFAVSEGLAGAEAILHTLRGAGVSAGFRLRSATLEDAFLHHIGELAERFDR